MDSTGFPGQYFMVRKRMTRLYLLHEALLDFTLHTLMAENEDRFYPPGYCKIVFSFSFFVFFPPAALGISRGSYANPVQKCSETVWQGEGGRGQLNVLTERRWHRRSSLMLRCCRAFLSQCWSWPLLTLLIKPLIWDETNRWCQANNPLKVV